MDPSSALQWWDEWQLRILVIGSLAVQYFLFISCTIRKHPIRSWFRPFIWLAYLSSDALAIYALATLFNRQKKEDGGHGHGNSILEVVWAPVLLMHLGGQDGITAYNIEDNELWTRHMLTALSQVTVAIYVFCKSWPGGDKRLLQASVLLFVPGILKCFEKPWALKNASINSLVSSSEPIRRSTRREGSGIEHIDGYVQKAVALFRSHHDTLRPAVDFRPYMLFLDLASPSSDVRLRNLQEFSRYDSNKAYHYLHEGLSNTFDLLYTKGKMFPSASFLDVPEPEDLEGMKIWRRNSLLNMTTHSSRIFGALVRSSTIYLPFIAVGLFHKSHREAYNVDDVKVTYALLCCTAALEIFARQAFIRIVPKSIRLCTSEDKVSQYSLIRFFIRNKSHSIMMRVPNVCKNYINQSWRMKSCSSSRSITGLVHKDLKGWWTNHIIDACSYRRFNDYRGQWALQRSGCDKALDWSVKGPFDESILLWHIATDFCFYSTPSDRCASNQCKKGALGCSAWCENSPHHEMAVRCREMSNYMVYLLFFNPEMLLAGTRRHLFSAAQKELLGIIKEKKLPPTERELTQNIIADLQTSTEGPKESFVYDARSIAEVLVDLQDEGKMWTLIKGVWVEMLCFSAARCRGYLHAKGLGTGVEYLSYVWLLLYYMGMETLPEKLQREELPITDHAGPSLST